MCKTKRKRTNFLRMALILSFLTISLAGCGKSMKLTEEEAKKEIIEMLEDKYGDNNFSVESVEEREGGAKYSVYYYCFRIKSGNDGAIFDARITKEGKEFTDNYEECLYKDEVERKGTEILTLQSSLMPTSVKYSYNESSEKSNDIEEYKKNNGVYLEVEYDLPEGSHDETVEKFYELASTLDNNNYCFMISVFKGSQRVRFGVGKTRESLTREYIDKAITKLEEK